jgi:hypothetical protein
MIITEGSRTYIPVREAVQRFHYSEARVYHLVTQGTVGQIEVGLFLYVSVDDLRQYARTQREQTLTRPMRLSKANC